MTLSSGAFVHGGEIPGVHTRLGADRSPPLAWSGVPSGATTLALVVEDPDAPLGTFLHWVIFDIPTTVRELAAGVPRIQNVGNGAQQGHNDYGRLGWGGPAPPPGPAHRYRFTLSAIAGRLGVSPRAPKAAILAAIAARALATAALEGRFAAG